MNFGEMNLRGFDVSTENGFIICSFVDSYHIEVFFSVVYFPKSVFFFLSLFQRGKMVFTSTLVFRYNVMCHCSIVKMRQIHFYSGRVKVH